jgi:pectinesterase
MNRRQFVTIVAGGAATPWITACAPVRADAPFDAVVSDVPGGGGAPVFSSVAAAIAAAPADAARPYRIRVARGRWQEKLVVDKPRIHLIGDDRAATVISHDTAAGQLDPEGKPWGTWGCATLIVRAPDFAATNLTIENAFDYVGNLLQPKLEPIGPNGPQAVALMLARGSDRALLEQCEIRGHQDTLFVDAGRSQFRGCRVTGSVDFVFGAGQAWFETCELVSRYRPGKERQGYVAVPSTPASQQFGLVFERCRLLKEAEVPARSVVLGRAWRPSREFADGRYGDPDAVGAAAFLRCWMDEHVSADGWDAMGYSARGGSRVMLEPAAARLFEYRSRGPGALEGPRRRQLSANAAQRFSRDQVLDGWYLPRF